MVKVLNGVVEYLGRATFVPPALAAWTNAQKDRTEDVFHRHTMLFEAPTTRQNMR